MDVLCDRCGYRVAVPSRAGTRCNQGDRTAPNGYCPGIMRPLPLPQARGSAETQARGTAASPPLPTPDLPFPQPPREPRESRSDPPTPAPTSPKRSGK